jgi:phosphoribosyl 1,2-cyclic phosphodiesterase
VAVRVVPLGSGSRGNATLVEFGSTRILVDAGLSARDLATRLQAVGVAPESVRCTLLSHEHQDHARGAERFSVRHRVPVVCAFETLEALNLSPIHLAKWHPFVPGQVFDLGDVVVDPFSVPHDAARPVGFVLRGEGVRIGIATDLGHATTLVVERLRGCNVLMVESNHDDRMLFDGPYPWHLKQRVGGTLGHLSNDEAASLVAAVADDDCRAVVLAHLSEKNNTTALARTASSTALGSAGRRRLEMRVARMSGPSVPVVL